MHFTYKSSNFLYLYRYRAPYTGHHCKRGRATPLKNQVNSYIPLHVTGRIQESTTVWRAEKWREARGSATWAAAIRRARGGAPWSLNGSTSVVEVGHAPYPSGKCNFNVFPVRIRIRIRSRISISSVSPGASHRVATCSHRLQILRAAE